MFQAKSNRMLSMHATATINLLIIVLVTFLFNSCKQENSDSVMRATFEGNGDNLERIKQELVAPPFLPKHDQVAQGGPRVVEVTLTALEKKMEIAPGDSIWALTFNGSVPAPIIVVHQDDFVELTLKNPSTNTMQHNIDFHAATGEMGGGELSLVNPGQEATFRFRATRTGVFVYHCAPGGLMVPIHVASGMNGVILVLPRKGLEDENGDVVKYDRAYYVVEQDYYLPKSADGKFKNFATPQESASEMGISIKTLQPTHLVFNGTKGALLGSKAMIAKVGENVLFISSNANRDTRIHLIGGHADLYWPGGKFNNRPYTDFETWAIPGGSAGAALYKFREPGTYVYLNHNLIEAFVLGAIAQIKVEGKWDESLMKAIRKPSPIK
jgi:nitrite reductase (NO-forming)